MDKRIAILIQKFVALSQAAKIEFLTRVIHDQTVGVRVIYLMHAPDTDGLRAKNQLIHEACNYIFQVLGVNRYLADNDIIESLVERLDAMSENGIVTLEKTLSENKISD